MNAGSLYLEVYDCDLQDPKLAPVAGQVDAEMKERLRKHGNPLIPRATCDTSWRQTARYWTFSALETLF